MIFNVLLEYEQYIDVLNIHFLSKEYSLQASVLVLLLSLFSGMCRSILLNDKVIFLEDDFYCD